MRWRCDLRDARGVSLLEVLVAGGILVSAALGIAPLFTLAAEATLNARIRTTATLLAAAKIEELRGTPWSADAGEPGPGLSPPGALDHDTPGFFDRLDAAGGVATAQAVYLRRWSVEPWRGNPGGARILRVAVTTVAAAARRARAPDGASGRLSPGVRLVALARRRAP